MPHPQATLTRRHNKQPASLLDRTHEFALSSIETSTDNQETQVASPAQPVRDQQREWARSKQIAFDDAGYTTAVRDNLFQALSPCSEDEFRAGDGSELGKTGPRGKMQALHSSSALVCNVFDYWRGRDTGPLAAALDIAGPICSIAFERKYPTGLQGKAPNLDVVLRPAHGPVLAIESKFLEPYDSRAKTGFKGKYFQSEPGLWQTVGYPRCQDLAKSLYETQGNHAWLHAAQLLKHVLGLSRSGGEWVLLYLWYELPGDAGPEHESEIAAFEQCATGDGILFRSLSYQELFRRLKRGSDGLDAQYLDYLEARYFPDVAD